MYFIADVLTVSKHVDVVSKNKKLNLFLGGS